MRQLHKGSAASLQSFSSIEAIVIAVPAWLGEVEEVEMRGREGENERCGGDLWSKTSRASSSPHLMLLVMLDT